MVDSPRNGDRYIIELPKFQKALDDLETNLEKWLFLFRHLSQLDTPPQKFQEGVFNQLFQIAEIAQLPPDEQRAYQNSLKYYRDLNNLVETAMQEGVEAGIMIGKEEGRQEGIIIGREEGRMIGKEEGVKSLLLNLLSIRFGEVSDIIQQQINQLSIESLETLSQVLFDLTTLEDLSNWLNEHQN
ncbi:MAG: DUF4351 domain-containing protein [Microcystaceae cyanobacterium]